MLTTVKEEKAIKNISHENKDDLTAEVETKKSSDKSHKDWDLEGRINALEQSSEQRISLETLFSQKFSDLRNDLRHDVNLRFGFAGVIITLILFVIGFLGSDYITKKVDEKFTEPEINKTVQKAMEEKGESFVATKVKPLEERVEQLNKDIPAKQDELANAQTQLGQALEIQQLSIGARAGSRANYEKLLELSKSEKEYIRKGAEVSLQDLEYYFLVDRHVLSKYLIDAKSKARIFISVEEISEALEHKEAEWRQFGVDSAERSNRKYFVAHLVRILINEPKETDLRVCTRITRALGILTHEPFYPLAFGAVASWWALNKSNEEYAWPFQPYFDGVSAMDTGRLDDALVHFDKMIEKEPQAFLSMVYKARILTEKGKYEEAEKVFKQVEDGRNDYRWLYVWRAFFFIKQDKQDDAINSINRALEISPGYVEEFVRSQPWAQALLSNKSVKWPSQNTEKKKEEIKQQ